MKILFVTYMYPPDIGGTAVLAERIVTALVDAGHDVTVLTTAKPQVGSTPGPRIVRARRIPLLYLPRFWLEYLRQEYRARPDFILVNDLPSAKSVALSFPSGMLRRTIVFIHGSEPENVFLAPSLVTQAMMFDRFYRRLVRRCHSIVAFSSFMKTKFLNHLGDASMERKIKICRHTINTRHLRKHAHARRTDRYIVLTVSRIVERKGFDRMFRIMSSVIARDPTVHWNIVGTGDYEETLQRRIKEAGLEPRMHLLGAISDPKQLERCYRDAHVFLLLSEYEEGLGLVYIEAAAHGLPSIANDKSGERESIEHGTSGFLTTTDQQVQQIILERRADRIRDSNSIYEFAARFEIERLPECIFKSMAATA